MAPMVNSTSPITPANASTISLCAHVFSSPNRYVKPTAAYPAMTRTTHNTAGMPSWAATRRILLASASSST
jgi:hypothetical protein